jgi:hypothetical protein
MLWFSCRSALVCRPALRARTVVFGAAALEPAFRSTPAELRVVGVRRYPVSLACPAAARFAAVVPGARRPL